MDDEENQDTGVESTEQPVSIYDYFKTDDGMEQTGIWIDYGPAGSFLIARAGGKNQKFNQVLQRENRQNKFKIDNDLLSEQEGRELMYRVFAEAVVKDWQDVRDRDGRLMQCTRDNIIKLFRDLPDLFMDIQTQAQKVANFREKELEDAAKNS